MTVFLTSLDDPVTAENLLRNIDLVRRRHLVLVNMIRPPGAVPLFTGRAPEKTDDIYGALGGHMRWQVLRELGKVLHRKGVAFSMLDSERMCVQLVTQYINIKRRQML